MVPPTVMKACACRLESSSTQDQVSDHEEPLFDILVVILAQYNKILGSAHIGIKLPLLRTVYLKLS
jgi:hypothetical protein